MDCVTPSHPDKIPHGESLDIEQLIAKGAEAILDPDIVPTNPLDPQKWPYEPREPVMAAMQRSVPSRRDLLLLKAQIVADEKELKTIMKDGATLNASSTGAAISRSETSSRKSLVSAGGASRAEEATPGRMQRPGALPQEPILPAYPGLEFADYAKTFQKDGWKARAWGGYGYGGVKAMKLVSGVAFGLAGDILCILSFVY